MATYGRMLGDSLANGLNGSSPTTNWYMWGLAGSDTLQGNDLADTLFGGDDNDFLLGNGGADLLYGGNGMDTLRGGLGGDRLDGGLGYDYASYFSATAGIRLALDGSLATTGEAAGDTFVSIEGVFDSMYSDVIIGDAGDNVIYSWSGNDRVVGGAGIDTYGLTPQAPFDQMGNPLPSVGGYLICLNSAQAQTMANTFGVGVVVPAQYGIAFGYNGMAYEASYGYDFLYGFENAIGTSFNDRFYGNDLDNIFTGMGGVDVFSGGVGFDTVSYHLEGAAVVIDMETNTHGGGATGDVLSSIEAIYASNWDDRLIGNIGDNLFFGGAGNDLLRGNGGADRLRGEDGIDIIDGGSGDDTIEGGIGADLIFGAAGYDTASYVLSASAVYLNLAKGVFTGGEATGDTLQDIENLGGSMLNDRMIGNASGNVLTGNLGDDTLQGCAGNDTIYGDLGPTFAGLVEQNCDCCEDDNHYSVRIFSDEERLQRAMPADPAYDDLIYGDEGSDKIFGEQGNDLLVGGVGNDTLSGGAQADILVGGAGNDVLEGGASFDILIGGADFDLASYAGSASGVNVNLAKFWGNYGGDASADVLEAIGSATAPASISELWTEVVLTGALSLLDLQGNTPLASGLPDVLVGIEGVIGSAFADVLVGDARSNSFFAGKGVDVVTGGAGADKFYFEALTDAADQITDFATGQDKIYLRRAGFSLGPSANPALLFNAAPATASAAMVYNTFTGELFFDSNGSGAGGVSLIATLTNLSGLTASDLVWY